VSVLFISEHYFPEPNCIVSDLARQMSERGHDVQVITAHPNYPLGKFYESARFPWLPVGSKENGVKVWRLPIYPYHGRSKIRRAASYISFLALALICVLMTQVLRWPKKVIVYQTPFTMALAALPLKIFGAKIAYLCVDLWPESFLAAGVAPRGWLLKLMFGYSRWINRRADMIITSTKGMKRRYLEDGIPDSVLHFVPVWVDGIPDQISLPQPLVRFPRKIVYAGNLGPAQGLGVLLEALSKIDIAGSRIELEFVGSGSEESALKVRTNELGLKNVTFPGRLSPSEAFESLSRATASIVHLLPSPLFRMTLPSKIASCLASGTVVICGVDGEAAEMFEYNPAVHDRGD